MLLDTNSVISARLFTRASRRHHGCSQKARCFKPSHENRSRTRPRQSDNDDHNVDDGSIARAGMEALDHRNCSWLWFGNHRRRRAISSSRKCCTRFQISCCGRTGFRERQVSTRIPLPRSAGIRLPGLRLRHASSLAQVDRVRQSQCVSDRIAGVVGSHEPAGSWWPTRLKVLGTTIPAA